MAGLAPDIGAGRALLDNPDHLARLRIDDHALIIDDSIAIAAIARHLVQAYLARQRLSDDNTLNDEITLVDPKAYTKPWTVVKSYERGEPGMPVLPYVCLENNRNPIGADGSIGVVLQGAPKK